MSIVRINTFQAKEGQHDALLHTLKSLNAIFLSMDGYQSHQVLQNVDDPSQMVVYEVWDSIEAHQLSTQKIPVHAFEKTMQLLAKPPHGEYYRS